MASRCRSTNSHSSAAEPARRIALLDPQMPFIAAQLRRPCVRAAVAPIDIYALGETDLTPYRALIVPGFADQEYLLTQRDRLRAFLDSGKALVFCGHLFRPWLPGSAPFVPKPIRSFWDYAVRIVAPHPIFAGVAADDLTFRRGVAGFFARGHHPPPAGAETLVAFASGEPTTYLDRQSTGGTILVHAGNDLLEYAGAQTAAGRIAPQLLGWLDAEYEAIQRRRAA